MGPRHSKQEIDTTDILPNERITRADFGLNITQRDSGDVERHGRLSSEARPRRKSARLNWKPLPLNQPEGREKSGDVARASATPSPSSTWPTEC